MKVYNCMYLYRLKKSELCTNLDMIFGSKKRKGRCTKVIMMEHSMFDFLVSLIQVNLEQQDDPI